METRRPGEFVKAALAVGQFRCRLISSPPPRWENFEQLAQANRRGGRRRRKRACSGGRRAEQLELELELELELGPRCTASPSAAAICTIEQSLMACKPCRKRAARTQPQPARWPPPPTYRRPLHQIHPTT